jgi:predicted lysophospholipase L1 biosynthesis ABC-type transport system permease subunit
MRPSLLSGLWIVAGVGTIAAAVALLVAIAAGWGAISGALDTGWSLDRWLVIEIALVGLVALFIVMRRRALRRP